MTQNPGGGRLSAATLADLEKPEKLETLLKQERVGDCLSCRLVGTSEKANLYFESPLILLEKAVPRSLGSAHIATFQGKIIWKKIKPRS